MVAEDLRRLEKRMVGSKNDYGTDSRIEGPPRILRSTEGIGKWGAAVHYIEVGDIPRFDSVEKLVACSSPDPQIEQGGDQVPEKGNQQEGKPIFVLLCMRP